MKHKRLGSIQKKIILALLGGVGLGLARTPRKYYQILRLMRDEWKKIDARSFRRSMIDLSRVKLVEERVMNDGSIRLELTDEGRKMAKLVNIRESCLDLKKPKRWDGRWRVVLFDIPEKDREFRDILREHLYDLEFIKLQKSVFVSPYPFEKQILKLVEIYSATAYVRVLTVVSIDNEKDIIKRFSFTKR